MANFAVLDGENIINTIVAESKTVAEEITGKTCVEFTTQNAEIGGTYVNGTLLPRKPFPSWVLNEDNRWEPPVVRPEGAMGWNESTISWIVE